MRNVAAATFIGILCCSTTSGTVKQPPPAVYAVSYYFYSADDDSYQAFNNTAAEISRLEDSLQVYVDNSSFGGTLIERGYNTDAYPHTVWPAILLYAHY